MRHSRHTTLRRRWLARESRQGSATVELAIVFPVLVLLVLGLIDVSQFLVAEAVINRASAVGALHAADATTVDVADVNQVIQEQVQEAYPNLLPADLNENLEIVVSNSADEALTGNALADLAPGEEFNINVTFSYEAVRWLDGFPGLNGRKLETKTTARRE